MSHPQGTTAARRGRARTVAIAIALTASVGLLPAGAGAQDAESEEPLDEIVETEVTTASDEAEDKIHADLREVVTADPSAKDVRFVARVAADADLSAYTGRWFLRPYTDPLGSTVAVGIADAAAIKKMAADPAVITLQRAESLAEPPAPTDPDVAKRLNAKVERRIAADAAGPGPAPEGWYHTGGAIHGSQQAWDKGYTGDGVRYMSNDSGADYCHPDLFGTWAYIDDATSPYHGLPEMFDSFSSYLAANDFYLGTSFVAGGQADYADTSMTASGDFSYAPIGAAGPHSYTVPGTSLSGVYHYGSHPDKALGAVADVISGAFGDGTAVAGERAAVLVVDEHTAGVYDTVYVDLNFNFDFTDDAPAVLSRDFTHTEAACLDYNGDSLNDISGGLVYFISDGTTAVPTLDWFWGIPGSFYGNGDLVAFHVMDFLEGGGDHGQGTTSVATGQGVVAGSVYVGPGGYPIADNKGLVVGPGKDVMSTQNGNFYVSPFVEDGFIYATLGYDGASGTADDVQIVSNSWGSSGIDNDGLDYESRLIDAINRALGPNTALLFSTGNGAAGYGTVAPPSPASGIGIGASTLYGSIGLFEAIESADQIVGGDPMSWSNRGPGARNTAGVDVVATGAFGTGDLPLNDVLDGSVATGDFGGTSMAAPVAAGNLALMYDAWRQRTGTWPTFDEAKALIMGTATDTDHDTWTQGAGLVNADIGTDGAGGDAPGVFATPTEWSAGDYRGQEYPAFVHVLRRGERDRQTFTLHNTSDQGTWVTLEPLRHRKIDEWTYTLLTKPQALDHGSFTTPDYAFRIDQHVPENTDLLQVRVTKPYEEFDPDNDLAEPFNNWRVHLQDWTDIDGDGRFWEDTDGDGKVDVGEMDTGEHIRFTYGYNTGPTQQARISNPHERIHDGLLLTLRHRDQAPSVDRTHLTIEASFWKKARWGFVQVPRRVWVPANGSKTFDARIFVPRMAPLGMYQGAIYGSYGDGREVVIPISAAVAGDGTSVEFGAKQRRDGTFKQGGPIDLYDNQHVFGYTDYNWRAESGDWRFFWTDVMATDLPASGTPYLVVDNRWASDGTDIDTIILGPTPDCWSAVGQPCGPLSASPGGPDVYGPYTLETVGRSQHTYLGSGRWAPQTSSGGPREIVSAPLTEGLHGLLFHQVKVDGHRLDEPFGGRAGLVTVEPSEIVATGPGSQDVTVATELELTDFVARGFGLGAPVTTTETVSQDDPNDPSTASFTTTVDVVNGALLEVSTCCSGAGSDIDLYVFGPDGGLLGASTTPTDEESVSIQFPADGTYTIAVHGWSVPAGTDTFDLTINAVQGDDVTASGMPSVIPAGGSGSFTVEWDTTGLAPGTYEGVVLFGPGDAPGLLQVPLTITVE